MPGGLLNIIAYGNQNTILNGNPKKSFFKTTYKKYTNFGLQKFRIDFDGQRKLRMSEESKFTFYMPRYAELLMDTYICVTLPTIWSPIYPPKTEKHKWAPYEFKWIKNLGTQMIKDITVSVGGQILQKFSGNYLLSMMQRDYPATKRDLYDHMTGNVPELNDPGCCGARVNQYPNAYYTPSQRGAEPSIRGRKLYIPINTWFTTSSQMAFPLVCLQYNTLQIDVTLRPVKELYVIRDVTDPENEWPYVQSNYTLNEHQFYRFLQSPPDVELGPSSYTDTRTDWNADVHMIATYGFLSAEETAAFAANEQKYLIKGIYEWDFKDVTGNTRVKLENTLGMVASWMFFFRRSDAFLRNEWSNYTNWPYEYLPHDIEPAEMTFPPSRQTTEGWKPLQVSGVTGEPLETRTPYHIGPGRNPCIDEAGRLESHTFSNRRTGYYTTGLFEPGNQKEILNTLGIVFNGKYRENIWDAGIYNYVEKYVRTKGNPPPGLYCYNFCINTDPNDLQPSGAVNMSKFTQVELELSTIYPSLDPNASFHMICDPVTRLPIGVNKTNWRIYNYMFDLTLIEERYNVLTFISGNCGLMYAR
jgi:hypothetical protein